MAYMVIEINASGLSIADLNDKVPAESGKPHEGVRGAIRVLESVLAGARDASVKVVTKDASTSISTSGSGSASTTFDLS